MTSKMSFVSNFCRVYLHSRMNAALVKPIYGRVQYNRPCSLVKLFFGSDNYDRFMQPSLIGRTNAIQFNEIFLKQ